MAIDQDERSLSAVATEALDSEEGDAVQEQLEDTVQVKFEGMAWDVLEKPDLYEEMDLIVSVKIVGDGRRVMNNGSIREHVNAKVLAVKRA